VTAIWAKHNPEKLENIACVTGLVLGLGRQCAVARGDLAVIAAKQRVVFSLVFPGNSERLSMVGRADI
jgi:hypothetical protein